MIKEGGVLKFFGFLFPVLSIICSGFFLSIFSGNSQNEARAQENSILINEIAWMGTEISANDEWIELFNNTAEDVVLDAWRIVSQDGSPEIELTGTIKAGGYFLLERSDDETVVDKQADFIYTGALGNNGEYLELIDSDGLVVDFLDTGEGWLAGDNDSKQTMSRTEEGEWLNSLDFNGTPQTKNDFADKIEELEINNDEVVDEAESEAQISVTVSNSNESKSKSTTSNSAKSSVASAKIIISEIFPNLLGSDEQFEFIELFNAGKETVDLLEWQIGDESQRRFRFKESKQIRAGNFLLLYRYETGIAMNNNGDTISLYKKDRKTATDKIQYEQALEGYSLNCLDNDSNILGQLANVDCQWSEVVSPGAKNNIILPNRTPEPDFSFANFLLARTPIIFDSSDTIDPDGDNLEYFWDFGDGFFSSFGMPDHTYASAGEYNVLLRVSDGELEEEIIRTINIMDWELDVRVLGTSTEIIVDWDNIVISEILPNPEGLDSEGEFVEIVNKGEHKIDLLNWQIDDAEGGSKPYTFGESIFLESGEHFLLTREDSGLALNNSQDEVRLIAPDKSVIDLLSYDKVIEGEAYVLGDNNEWSWSSMTTPGEKNKIELTSGNREAGDIRIYKDIEQTAKMEINKLVSLENVANIKLGTMISVKGRVAVGPGVLGAQYFYIVGPPGLQIYNYKKDFPDLSIGDSVFIEGELVSSNGERRLKTKSMTDMVVLGHDDAPAAKKIICEDIENLDIGSLFEVTGVVVEKKGSSVFLDDGSGEVLVYIKKTTNIELADIKKGDSLIVTGILSTTANGRRIMPREKNDIVLLRTSDPDNEDGETGGGQVLGEEVLSDTWELTARDKSREGIIYFFIILGASFVVLLFLFFKYRRSEE